MISNNLVIVTINEINFAHIFIFAIYNGQINGDLHRDYWKIEISKFKISKLKLDKDITPGPDKT